MREILARFCKSYSLNYRPMKYRINNPADRTIRPGFITFDMNDKRTRVPNKN